MKYKISEVCDFVGTGGTPSRKNKNFYDGGTIKWLKTKELNDKIIYDTEEYITDLGLQKSSAKLYPSGTVTMAMYGATVGKLGILDCIASTNQACCNMIVNNNRANNKYLFYALLNNRAKIISLANGAAQQNLNKTVIENFEIDFHEIKEQQIIAKILSDLDDKIEINNKINTNLESVAQEIFKHWFVDFEFPNENGEPYKSSGGEMIGSKLSSIPKFWGAKTIADISSDIITGKTPSTKNKENFNGDIPFIKIPDMHNNTYIVETESNLSKIGINKNKIISKNSVIVSCIATPGLVSLAAYEAQTNQQINTIICNQKEMCYFTYFALKNLSGHIITLGSGGSTTLNLNKTEFSKIQLIVPDSKSIEMYYELVNPLFEKILNNQVENTKLKKIRDTLLPKLMSGELNINNID